jgi:tetratricopeptide (TPR) repeat protein
MPRKRKPFIQRARWLLTLASAALALISATAAYADKPIDITAAEVALLPKYCADAQTFKYGGEGSPTMSPNAPHWVELMGRGFWAIHHYCWALINLSRAQRPSMPPATRQATREYAIDDMKFVIANTSDDFVMLPEIYTKIGTVQLLLKRPTEAHAAFVRASALKPDYWPPYYHWAEYLRQAGQKAEARQVAEEGLSYSPNARTLQSLFVALGGNPASITPRPTPEATPESTDTKEPAK